MCVVVLLFLLTGCSKEEEEKKPIVSVQTTPAEKSSISQIISAEAVVFPLEQATITPKITARITEFTVNRGSRVKKGDLLARLENKDLAAAAESSKGDLDTAMAQYEVQVNAGLPQQIQKAESDAAAAQAAYEAAQKIFESRKDLFQQGAIPRRDLDSAQVALVQAKGQNEQAQKQLADLRRIGEKQGLKAAQGTLSSTKGKYDAAAAQLSYSEIRSPISGVVTDRPLYPGEMATAGTPLLTVMDLSHVIAKAHIPQAEAALLKVGDTASVSAPGLEDPMPAKVSVVSPALDPNSTTVEVWVDARNPHQELKPGTSVSISMLAQTIPDALTVPAAAVLTEPDGTTSVMVIGDDSRAHQRDVKTGVRQENQIQIVSGLKAGERVVTAGAYGLPDNTRVQLQAPPSQPVKESKE